MAKVYCYQRLTSAGSLQVQVVRKRTSYFLQQNLCSVQLSSILLLAHCMLAYPLHRISLTDLYICSKTAPPASTYDDPGKPFEQLTKTAGCALGPTSVACLQALPFEVSISGFYHSSCVDLVLRPY